MLEEHWGAPKDKQLTLIKRSYNTVYSAVIKDGQKVVVRTNGHNKEKMEKVFKNEMIFMEYLSKEINVTPYVEPGVVTGPITQLCVQTWASGSPIDDDVMKSEEFVRSSARWLSNFHRLSRQFAVDHPEIYKEYLTYETVKDGVMGFKALSIP